MAVATTAVLIGSESHAAQLPTARFEVGGNASAASNSLGAAWGAEVSASSGSSYIVAAGDGQVMCRIIVNGRLVAEAHAAGAGQRASCAFG